MKKHVCIVIPTFRRPRLLGKCLNSVAFLHITQHTAASCIVVDNNPDKSAKSVVDAIGGFPMPLHYEFQPAPGVSAARNLGIEKALQLEADAVLFIDDDMYVPPDYLCILLDEMQKLSAGMVRGQARIIEEGGVKVHVNPRVFGRPKNIRMPSNGLLVSAKIFKDWNLRFDTMFLRHEDYDFTYRAYLRGARLFTIRHAFFNEFHPPERFSKLSFKEKINSRMRVSQMNTASLKYRGGTARAFLYVCRKVFGGMARILIKLFLFPFSPYKNARKIRGIFFGLIGTCLGLRRPPYKYKDFFTDEKRK